MSTEKQLFPAAMKKVLAADFVRPPAQRIMTYSGKTELSSGGTEFRSRRNRAGAKLKLSEVQIGYLCIALSLPVQDVVPGETKWSIKVVQEFIKSQFGVCIGTKGAWLYMKRCNFLMDAARTGS